MTEPDSNEHRSLADRLGQADYERRRRIEGVRLFEHRAPANPHLTAFKIRVVRPIIAACFRATGLYRHGHRQFRSVRVLRHDVPLARLPPDFDGFTVLHLSDLHIDLEPSLVDSVAEVLKDLSYDLCAITGDFRNLTVGPWEEAVRSTLALRRSLTGPVYAVLGNHDALDMVPPLEAGGVRFLLNECVTLRRGDAALCVAGIDDPNIYRTGNLERALRGRPEGVRTILLSHSPAIHREARGRGVDLVLAGHTHGGQICLPGGRILVLNDSSPRAMLRGPWRFGSLRGYTSAGTGACGLPLRLNCPPEVTLHVLRSS
jgi:predicted MPP superfamily phosphohydrolase